jgi:hypothetical protein
MLCLRYRSDEGSSGKFQIGPLASPLPLHFGIPSTQRHIHRQFEDSCTNFADYDCFSCRFAMAVEDDWPTMPDGTDYDGKNLLALVRGARSPFDKDRDVKLLINEIENVADAQVVDIPAIKSGSNHYVRSPFVKRQPSPLLNALH